MRSHQECIGLVPAGGMASRVAPLPCSKEVFPIGFHPVENDGSRRPKVIGQYLLEKMRFADIEKAYIILREGKWDIPSYFGDGKTLNMHLAYLMLNVPFGVPYTLDQAYPFIKDARVALGFPDMIFQPEDAFVKLLAKQEESQADIVLGLFPAHQPPKTDMVELNEHGQVLSLQIKPPQTHLLYAWEIAVWTPVFTRFMHDYVSDGPGIYGSQNEMHVADVIQAALQDGLKVDSVLFKEGCCLDIGTPEDMLKAIQETMEV